MTALAVETAAACLGIGLCGYLVGRMHAATVDRRPGYVPIPMVARVDNWAGYPYDQHDDEGLTPIETEPLMTASLGHPLIPDMRGYDDGGEFSTRVDPIAHLTAVTLDMTHKALGS